MPSRACVSAAARIDLLVVGGGAETAFVTRSSGRFADASSLVIWTIWPSAVAARIANATIDFPAVFCALRYEVRSTSFQAAVVLLTLVVASAVPTAGLFDHLMPLSVQLVLLTG